MKKFTWQGNTQVYGWVPKYIANNNISPPLRHQKMCNCNPSAPCVELFRQSLEISDWSVAVMRLWKSFFVAHKSNLEALKSRGLPKQRLVSFTGYSIIRVIGMPTVVTPIWALWHWHWTEDNYAKLIYWVGKKGALMSSLDNYLEYLNIQE